MSTDALDGRAAGRRARASRPGRAGPRCRRARPRRSRAASPRGPPPTRRRRRCALAWSCVASRISPAWFVVFCAPVTVVALTSRVSAACCEASWPCCCSSTCRAGASSTVASTSPAVTFWPTLTSTVLIWPPLRNPRFCSVTAVSDPDDETAVVTLVRWTRAVGGAGGPDDVVHATSVAATSTMGTAVRSDAPEQDGPRAQGPAVPGARGGRGGDDLRGRLDRLCRPPPDRRPPADRRAPARRTATGRLAAQGMARWSLARVILHRVTRGVPRRRRVGTDHAPPPDGWNIQASSGALDHGWWS